ncbi:hypothetical protein C8F04DRAFT_1264984 [Mycena alexandri]|uniref:CxC2-like cysteine cluster KDZ transposase-associated domain-containing protein n=1 Tax=Mycena alexandri TaxID=1745969 RepID=A0AAD6SPA2_9AGAR|nr:hypothetical protein C8F04DRAFT_1264984 [Mycena alexandri]
MHAHEAHIAEVVSVSSSGRTATTRAHIIEASGPSVPAYEAEDLATNVAAESFDFSYDLGDTGLPAEVQPPETDGIELTAKRKVYENSDYPMKTWAKHQGEYLDEMLRLEGRGYAAIYSMCLGCGGVSPTFRCMQQTCYGPGLYCQACLLTQHACLPTHWVEEWNGRFFERRELAALGLVVQLGHPSGFACGAPVRASKEFCVIDVTGIHKVNVNFCLCDSKVERRQQLMRVCWWPATARDPQTCATFGVIRLFQLLNCLGKVSAHDFLRSLELLTNNDGLSRPTQRRRAFRHIVRQYRTTLMMKRAGRGHALSGIGGTAQGELALRCRACPQPGRNLPEGWDRINWAEMPEDLRYKYFLFLAQDCNFRLINRNVSSEAKDPIVGDGLGYFVNHEEYAKYLRAHVSEEEISTCSGFQAMFLANRKRVKGLRTTGLGERQCNMDFILFSALLNTLIFYLILSYDIACQYSKHFWTRMESLPAAMHLVVEQARVWFKIPNFHLPPHKPPCHSPYSFHYMWGAGRTHGETVEQNWEFTNGAAASTKMMGLGTRAATLEDLFGFHNWRRLVSWRGIFTKRMGENVKEGQVHRDAFEAFDAALREVAPELVEGWKEWVNEWESRQHTDGAESPFELKERVTSMRDIRLKLAKEELLRSGEGVEVEREDTPSTFIIMGLEIEETQRNLAVDVKALANPTDVQTVGFLKRRAVLTKRIRAFRKLQRTYMPKVRRFLNATQRALWDSEAEREPEAVRLFMPSEMGDKTKREKACAVGLAEVEAELRVGEAREALEELRQGLRTRTMTNRYRLRHCTGQRLLTRGQGILRQINVKIHKTKLRYRYARHALTRLKEHGPWERELKVLEESDVRALNERALTEEEAAQRRGVHDYKEIGEEGGIAALGAVALGEGRRTLSWIWYTAKTTEPDEAELVEALRVEWCKAYARMNRWHEDVVLVEEEMRRTIEYGYWSAYEWLARSTERANSEVSEELQEGLMVYALEQADRENRTCAKLTADWSKIREKGRAYLAKETMGGEHVVVSIEGEEEEDDDDSDGDDEEGPPDYEDEGDDEVME